MVDQNNDQGNRGPSEVLKKYCEMFGCSPGMILSKSRDTVTAEMRKKIALKMKDDGLDRNEISFHMQLSLATLSTYFSEDKQPPNKETPEPQEVFLGESDKLLGSEDNKPIIVLDFTKHQELYERICGIAEERLRKPKNQVMWWLINTDFSKLNKGLSGE